MKVSKLAKYQQKAEQVTTRKEARKLLKKVRKAELLNDSEYKQLKKDSKAG